jgi:hypothetical protein
MVSSEDTRDKGLSKEVIAVATFAGSVLTAAASNFTVFKVGDLIEIAGTEGGLNNGNRTILALTTTTLTCDWPFKTEGPTSNVEIRTT